MPLETLNPDPLESYSGLSLFTRTLAPFPNPPRPLDTDDIQRSHDYLESMPLQGPTDLLEQARAIVDDSSKLVNLDMASCDAEVVKNPQEKGRERERRPGLERKRARFSFKPDSSQQTLSSLVSSIDIDKLKDPDEFFSAFERAEFAKKEIEKELGVSEMDLDQNVQSVVTRPRRPGLQRKSVQYKHLYPTATSSVESFEEEILSPPCGSQQEKADLNVVELPEKEFTGSVNDIENKVDKLLDHLLTSDYDGDETFSLLQERLLIKPIVLEKICLPDLQDIRRLDLRASRENITKPSSSDCLKGIGKMTPKRQAESSVYHLASTTPRSSLASISLLTKRKLQSDVLNDPFSTDNIHQSPVTNASSIENSSKQSEQVDTENELSMSHKNDRRSSQQQAENSDHHLASLTPPRNPLASMSLQKTNMLQSDTLSDPFSTGNIENSPGRNASMKVSSQVDIEKELNMSPLSMLEANQTATAYASSELDERDFAGLFDKFVNDNAGSDSCINVVSSGSQADLENNSFSRPEVDADDNTIEPNECGGRVEDIPPKTVAPVETEQNMEGLTVFQRGSDEPYPLMDVDNTMDGSSRATESVQQPLVKKNRKGKTKQLPRNEHMRKALSCRQSLAGSGTTFDADGRRRSTRIRSRPLEFWNGERFLYGRIHSSLATVIGIKYNSPGNSTLKVKSFVSDEYKDLVELAARF